ncbi:MAG: hypothetical protein M0R74_00095 [Dehalococcoidia bacterium]|nr:hypothetical protein [Dehalococcoidia bacterium]
MYRLRITRGGGVMRVLLAMAVALLAVALSAACSESDPPPMPSVREARAERDVVDGEAQLTTTVTVAFDRVFELAESRVPLASKFEFAVPGSGPGGDQRVLVREAEVQPGNGRVIVLRVDALIPAESELKVSRSAFRRNEPGELVKPVTSDLAAEITPLAAMAFAVTREGVLGEAAESPPPSEADRDPAVQREALAAHLDLRGMPPDATRRALARYDTIPPELVPSPKLRAALAGLTGTFAEPAIDDLLTAANCTEAPVSRIVFEAPPDEPDLFARVTFEDTGARVVSIAPALESEPFERLIPVLAHEAVHCDREDGKFEEVAATAFDTFLWIQLLSVDPSLAEGRTQLARELNIDAVAMFNSGRRFPEALGLLPSVGVVQALPLTSAEHRSFADLVAAAYGSLGNNSPDEPLARQYVQLLAQATGHPEGSPFNLIYLDELLSRATSSGLLAALLEIYELAPTG